MCMKEIWHELDAMEREPAPKPAASAPVPEAAPRTTAPEPAEMPEPVPA